MDSEGAESDDYWPYSAGFDEAAARSEKWELVARSLVTDRSYLLIPAWVCMAALVLAAALTRVSTPRVLGIHFNCGADLGKRAPRFGS